MTKKEQKFNKKIAKLRLKLIFGKPILLKNYK